MILYMFWKKEIRCKQNKVSYVHHWRLSIGSQHPHTVHFRRHYSSININNSTQSTVLCMYNLQLYCIVHKAEFFWWKAARAGHKQIFPRHRVTRWPEVLPDLYCTDCPFSGVNTGATDPSPVIEWEEGNLTITAASSTVLGLRGRGCPQIKL